VVAEQVPAHDGDERPVGAAEEPDALVEDAEVVPEGAEAVVVPDRPPGGQDDVENGDGDDQQPPGVARRDGSDVVGVRRPSVDGVPPGAVTVAASVGRGVAWPQGERRVSIL
jgi:hypothetical protein